MKIIIDTREQKPLWQISQKVRATKLEVGDYTTESLKDIAHIERKSAIDLYGSIIQGHTRFRNMFLRAKELNIEVVVFVECTESAFYNKVFDRGSTLNTKGETLKKILSTMQEKYNFEIVWCTGREDMQMRAAHWLRQKEWEKGFRDKR